MANSYADSGSSPNVNSVREQEWATKLQERLNKPTTWKDVADVVYTDTYIVNMPYMSTSFAAQTGTRGTAYSFSDFTITNDQLQVNQRKLVPIHMDAADIAQCRLASQMEMSDRQGALLNEAVETAMLADTAATDFGDTGGGALGLGTTAITVSATTIPKIIRGVRREVITANGMSLMNRNGIFFVWRSADMEYLEEFAQANGFQLADVALKNGVPNGYFFMGAYHYVSNSHAAGHLLAGVKKIFQIGILRATYGQIVIVQDPAAGAANYGPLAGLGIRSQVDYGVNLPTGLASIVFDINVA